jgi:hypothetical protein
VRCIWRIVRRGTLFEVRPWVVDAITREPRHAADHPFKATSIASARRLVPAGHACVQSDGQWDVHGGNHVLDETWVAGSRERASVPAMAAEAGR